MTPIADVWVYLSTSPLLGLTLTLLAYQAAYWIYQRAGFNPLLNPVLLAIIMLVTALLWPWAFALQDRLRRVFAVN